MAKVADRYLAGDSWNVVEKGFHPEKQRVSESIFSLSNEFMGLRGYFEEGYSGDHLQGSYFGGLYENKEVGHPQVFKGFVTRENFIVNACDWLYTRIYVKGEQLDLARSKFSDFTRSVNLKTGVMERSFVWHTKSGARLKISFTRFLSMGHNNMAMQRMRFESLDKSCKVVVRTGLSFATYQEIAAGWDMRDEAGSAREIPDISYWDINKRQSKPGRYAIQASTKTTGFSAFCSYKLSSNISLTEKPFEREETVGCDVSFTVKRTALVVLDKTIVNFWERPSEMNSRQVWSQGTTLFNKYKKTAYEKALAEQEEYWAKFWETRDIVIQGDNDSQQGVRFDIMQLHMAYHGGDERLAIPSKGLTAEVYSGWIFWVVETYCQHMMIFSDPEAAKKLLKFRYHGLKGALQRATEVDCTGARYPFCTIDGPESCATWQHADMEIHVGVGIYRAIELYIMHTDDKDFLYTYGIEMLLQISRYYASRGDWSPRGDFGFYGVMGPDEYKSLVHHNYYTNFMGKKCFEYTLKVIREMQTKAPKEWAKVKKTVGLTPREPEEWKKMASKMRLLKDPKTGVCEQHDGYFDLPEVDVASIGPDQIPIYKNWAYEKILRMNMVKQADVLLLPVWFAHQWNDKDTQANFDFYEPRTIHESTFSISIHQILFAELGRLPQAYDFFKYMCRVDLDDYQKNTAQGLHMTPKSGTWLSMVYGWGGMRTGKRRLSFAPSIPKKWKRYRFRIVSRSTILEVTVDHKEVQFAIVEGPSITIEAYGKKEKVTQDGVTVKMPKIKPAKPMKINPPVRPLW
ncbi:MAG: family 65 glycosyl hydrolase [Chitinivibrionales bacterium]|nr:family 65 glycosyl hydrolase [Chitinivibrionales bacterium]